MRKILKASSWQQLRDIRPEPEEPKPAQPKMPVPERIVATTAEGTRLVAP